MCRSKVSKHVSVSVFFIEFCFVVLIACVGVSQMVVVVVHIQPTSSSLGSVSVMVNLGQELAKSDVTDRYCPDRPLIVNVKLKVVVCVCLTVCGGSSPDQ